MVPQAPPSDRAADPLVLVEALMPRLRAMFAGHPDPQLAARIHRGKLICQQDNTDLDRAYTYRDAWEACERHRDEDDTARLVPIVREIREWAPRWKPYAEKRARELEWAKPRPGDYTGRLSPAEYFGTDAPQQQEHPNVTRLESRRAA